ncbi:MAG TPA: GatB/YqeY domain-containing protein [Rhodothermales bacterium]|nr:GatB/YqeY domain-containing protein [Rhodothermales bacterium]
MALRDRLNDEMKDAMRAGDKVRLGAIRMLSAALLEREKDGRGVAITEADETAIVQKQAKQRRDSITQFRDNGRDDLAVKEEAELAIIEAYLPAQLSDEEIAGVVAGIMAGVDATGPQAMGRVMGEAMKALKGQADGARVRAAVEQALKG